MNKFLSMLIITFCTTYTAETPPRETTPLVEGEKPSPTSWLNKLRRTPTRRTPRRSFSAPVTPRAKRSEDEKPSTPISREEAAALVAAQLMLQEETVTEKGKEPTALESPRAPAASAASGPRFGYTFKLEHNGYGTDTLRKRGTVWIIDNATGKKTKIPLSLEASHENLLDLLAWWSLEAFLKISSPNNVQQLKLSISKREPTPVATKSGKKKTVKHFPNLKVEAKKPENLTDIFYGNGINLKHAGSASGSIR